MNQRITVNLRSRGQQESRSFLTGQTQSLVSAEGAHLQSLDRQFQVINRAGRRSKMPNVIHRTAEEQKLGNILLHEFEVRVACQVRNIIDATCNKVVDGDHKVPAFKQEIDEVGSQETGAAGHN